MNTKNDQPQDAISVDKNSEDLTTLSDVPMRLSALLGGTHLTIKDLISLKVGSVIELEKLAGESIEVCLGDRIIAKGEVVVVNEKYGLRLTDIVSPNSNS
jgi:flagellar motor switch protein FliN/FliY